MMRMIYELTISYKLDYTVRIGFFCRVGLMAHLRWDIITAVASETFGRCEVFRRGKPV